MKHTWFQHGGSGLGFLSQPAMTTSPAWPGRRKLTGALRAKSGWSWTRAHTRTLILTLVGLTLGIAIVAQWQSPLANVPAEQNSRYAAIQRTIDRLEAEQVQLKKQISDLRARTTAEQQQLSRSESATMNLGKALAEQRALAGTVAVRGNGIVILLDDSTNRTILPSDDPDNYIVHEYQIRDIVNLLWGSGASAIAVNGERFVNSTSVYCVGSTILINDTRTSPPYHILAIGDTSRMQQALDDGNTLRDLKARVQAYGLVLKVIKTGTITVPAFDGSVEMKHTNIAYTNG